MLTRALLSRIGETRPVPDEVSKARVFQKSREMIDFQEDWTFVENQQEDEVHEKDAVSIVSRLWTWSKLCEESIRGKSVR